MKAYVIDEISRSDMDKIESYLREHTTQSALGQVFWIRLPDHLLTKTQAAHASCRPHAVAVEAEPGRVKFEFFVRSLATMQCSCPGYCTPAQREYIIRLADEMVESLNIRT